MSTRVETIEFLTDQLSALPNIRTRSMFGEYGLYCDEKVVAFVCDDTLFVKPTDAGRDYLGTPDEAPAYPGSKMYFRINGDRWEDREWLAELIDRTAGALPLPKPKTARKPKAAGTPRAGQPSEK